jgi:hypothetical protein
MKYLPPYTVLLLTCIVPLAGCERPTPSVDLRVERVDWDSVRVYPVVTHGTRADILAAALFLFDAHHDTLYAGEQIEGVVAVPDHRLGDEEPVLLEYCATFAQGTVCDQQSFTSSPKRLRVVPDITFADGAFDRGRYEVEITVERERHDGAGWESVVNPRAPIAFLQAFVESPERGSVRAPLTGTRGQFNLATDNRYRDFRFAIDTDLYERQRARVTFEVHASLNGRPELVATVYSVVRPPEQDLYVRQVTQIAASRLARWLTPGDAIGTEVIVDDWTFDRARSIYEAQFGFTWRDRRGETFEMDGTLTMEKGGSNSTFMLTSASDETMRLWRSRSVRQSVSIRMTDPEPTHRAPTARQQERRRPWWRVW